MSTQICQKVIKMAAILEFFGGHFRILLVFLEIFLLENVAPSHNLILMDFRQNP